MGEQIGASLNRAERVIVINAILIWVILVALVAMQPDDAINTEPPRPRGLWR